VQGGIPIAFQSAAAIVLAAASIWLPPMQRLRLVRAHAATMAPRGPSFVTAPIACIAYVFVPKAVYITKVTAIAQPPERRSQPLATGELQRHRRELLLTKLINADYDLSAQCPHWIEFLNEILAPELVVDIQERSCKPMAPRSGTWPLVMIEGIPGDQSVTAGADKNYDTQDFVAETRHMQATPHVAQNNKNRKSAMDGRTTRHAGCAISQQKHKRIEEIFGWMKTVGGMRKLRHRGLELVGWMFTLAAATYNMVRIRNLATANEGAKV
jgi:hypothetical protein